MTTDICLTLLRKGLDINKIYYLYQSTNETGFAEIGLNDFLKTFNYINNNNALNEELPEDINKKEKKQKEKVNFISKKKRGKKNLNKSGKYHSANSNDNIRTKFQVYYLNFIIDFFNEISYTLFGIKKYFHKFDYSQKSKIKIEYTRYLQQLSLEEIIEEFDGSTKYTQNVDSNAKMQKLLFLKNYEPIKRLLNMNYLNFVKVYYNDNKPLNEYKLGDINIKLTKAKSFSYLLKKNKEYEEGFKMILKMDYLDKIDFDNKIDEMKFDNFRLI